MVSDLGAAALYELMHGARWQGSCLLLSAPLFGTQTYRPSKNREKIRALSLGGRQSIERYINQPRLGVSGRKSLTEEERLGRNAWGCVVLSFGVAICETQIK